MRSFLSRYSLVIFLGMIIFAASAQSILAATCTEGAISTACQCGDQQYAAGDGFCCDVGNGDNGVYFKAEYYDACPSNIYYISNDGNDANPGTFSQPWKTMNKTQYDLYPGDAGIILGGTYNENNNRGQPQCGEINHVAVTLDPKHSGTPGNYVIIKGHPDYPRPIIKGSEFPSIPYDCGGAVYESSLVCEEGRCLHRAINIGGMSYMILDHLEVTDSLGPGIQAGALSNSFLQDLYIHETVGNNNGENPAGILLGYDGARNVVVRDSEFYNILTESVGGAIEGNNRPNGIFDPTPFCTNCCGITMYRNTNVTIENNYFHRVQSGTFLKYGPLQDIVVRDNIMDDTWIGVDITGCDSINNLIYGNIVINSNHGARPVGNSEECAYDNNDIIQNTFYDNAWDGSGTSIFSGYGSYRHVDNTDLKNNILMNNPGKTDVQYENLGVRSTQHFLNLDTDYNIYFDTFQNTVVNWMGTVYDLAGFRAATGYEEHSLQQDPQFVSTDLASPDFMKLSSGSPAIDKGQFIPGFHCPVNIETDPNQEGCRAWSGNAPDIGAIEYLSGGTYPSISNVQCYDGSTWKACTAIIYGNTVQQVRADCSVAGKTISSAQFKLEGLQDKYIYFDGTGSGSGATWTYDNPDAAIQDSGAFRLTATCTDSEGHKALDMLEWDIPWGSLQATQLTPSSAYTTTGTFSFQTRLSCVGGECGGVTATLDPLLSQDHPAYESSYREPNEKAGDAFDGVLVDPNDFSRWVSETGGDPHQWIYVDLEKYADISGVDLYWDHAYGKTYTIQVSNDTVNWVTVASVAAGDGGTDSLTFAPVTGKYVKLDLTVYGSATYDLYTLFEMQVFGEDKNKGTVPMNSGSPFYTTTPNPQSCANLKGGDQCTLAWTVVPTGANGSTYRFFVNYDPASAELSPISSPYVDITIGDGPSCALSYDHDPCDCISTTELITAIGGWYQGTLDIPDLILHIAAWKANSSC